MILNCIIIFITCLEKITFAFRGYPVIGDATKDEAQFAGLTKFVEVIDNGSDAPGTIINECKDDFRQRFEKADLIIAKGQGNYGSLSEVCKDIFFLLKANCQVIARDIGCRVGSLVLHRSEFGQNMVEETKMKIIKDKFNWSMASENIAYNMTNNDIKRSIVK